ncbi:antibiotic biosynthesis monooxygenase [Paracoccus suum]|uniref:Antibiotic biosynthesis monooxygenase n=1 Tax=Paracoccus suum TaxID=2259340 RepID=A0A344PLV9_9RHOB|nr:antibiotic biosynthesis monooxygenase [Paracoccus suum]AXC50364.1 antibiotic biosynthesis monooxygenase [Paracoccus suum]
MPNVHLNGLISCKTEAEAAVLREHLPAHLSLTLAEPGCVAFSVTPEGPRGWRVAETFVDEAAFAAHQRRAAASDWGRVTAGFVRDYLITRDD